MNVSFSELERTGAEFGIVVTIRLYISLYPLKTQEDRIKAISILNDIKHVYMDFCKTQDPRRIESLSGEIYQIWEEFSALYAPMLDN
tara:strand:+ start:909 stop:1169 length:261 start_codon:yes stop_codon:yes gene_type:complete